MEIINAIGRRKAAVARVYLTEGTGNITINKRPLDVYFPSPILQYIVKQPLKTLDAEGSFDIKVSLNGGGYKGQAEALRLAIARALVKNNPEVLRLALPVKATSSDTTFFTAFTAVFPSHSSQTPPSQGLSVLKRNRTFSPPLLKEFSI